MKRQRLFGALCLLLTATGWMTVEAATLYVDASSVNPVSPFTNWATAAASLQAALGQANSNDAIWVARGTNYPGVTRTDAFVLKNGVSLYGGFTNGMTDLGQRNWTAYPSILSGDIDNNGVLDAGNSYHVLIATNNATLDGFTVTMGYANASPNDNGGAMYGSNVAPTLANCTFSGNFATNSGGGVALYSCYSVTNRAVVTNCVFMSNNAGTNQGGGLYFYCLGASGKIPECSPRVSGCTFSGNRAGYAGGGSCCYNGNTAYNSASQPVYQNCTFVNNLAVTNDGGGLHFLQMPKAVVSACTFASNTVAAGNYNGGGMSFLTGSSLVVSNCVFSGNNGANAGGGVYLSACSNPTFVGCTFAGNTVQNYGGGVDYDPSGVAALMTVQNCAFIGNYAKNGGGGLYFSKQAPLFTTSSVINCTFYGNMSKLGYAIYNKDSVQSVSNCIFWTNFIYSVSGSPGGIVYNTNCTWNVSYSDILGGWNGTNVFNTNGVTVVNGGGNLTNDPAFAGGASGTWSANGSYNASLGQSTLTKAGAAWPNNAFAGMFLNPKTSQTLQLLIATNDATTITVWGDASGLGSSGVAYQLYDYHLKSKVGRWVVGTASWVTDTNQSPCIDAGDPNAPCSNELPPNGHRINMGADGNTAQASKSITSGTVAFFR